MCIYIKAFQKAARKAITSEVSDSWEAYDFENVEGGMICRGSDMKVITKGKNKGETRPLTTGKLKVFVTKESVDKELEILKKQGYEDLSDN